VSGPDEAGPIAYNIYFDEDCTQVTVVPIHPSSASMELHMLSCPTRSNGAGWGVTVGQGRAKSVKPTFEAEPNSLLSGFF